MARTRNRRKLPALLLAAALILAGFGSVTAEKTSEPVVTGHTTFADTTTKFNNCFAAMAGGIMQRVVWFNGATLFSRMANGDGNTWLYVTEHFPDKDGGGDGWGDNTSIAIKDPSQETLYRTNNTYTFPDENLQSKEWEVREYFALRQKQDQSGSVNGPGGEQVGAPQEKVYVFAVQVNDEAITDQTINRDYNFALVIDTCRFHEKHGGTEIEHNNNDTVEDGDSEQPDYQHKSSDYPKDPDGTHDHNRVAVDLWVGGPPTSVEAPVPDGRDSQTGDGPGEEAE